jgi:hypothetical protein
MAVFCKYINYGNPIISVQACWRKLFEAQIEGVKKDSGESRG